MGNNSCKCKVAPFLRVSDASAMQNNVLNCKHKNQGYRPAKKLMKVRAKSDTIRSLFKLLVNGFGRGTGYNV